MEPIITVTNVSMHFNLMVERVNSLKEYLINFFKGRLLYHDFLALDNVSFEINRGEIVGIIGLNGSGKSTLLKIIAGVLVPSSGSVQVRGSMAPLIELGAGFDAELTAEENIFLNGALLGYSRSFMQERFREIIEFAELEGFEQVPLKNFSSGMQSRLGFSIATIVQPEILLVDEVLSVGDFKFRKKCEKRIQQMIENGVTVVLVSHSSNMIETMCSRAVWLEHGKLRKVGEAKAVCEEYLTETS
ncbi:MAG: ABC transporter ATP-binding protein [Treponema sp.]|nr:ABC transporter ATP-binding protein [Treponema sp.]